MLALKVGLALFVCMHVDFALASPNSTSNFRNRQYGYFTHERVNYLTAVQRCADWNGTLVKVNDSEIQGHIISEIPIDYNCTRSFFYMGLYRVNQTNLWRWPDNTQLGEFENWRRSQNSNNRCMSEPNGLAGCFNNTPGELQYATQLAACPNHNTSTLGDWFDKNENTSRWYYICERAYVPMATTMGVQMTTEIFTTPLITTEQTIATETIQTTFTNPVTVATTDATTTVSALEETTTQVSHTSTPQALVNPALSFQECLGMLFQADGVRESAMCRLSEIFSRGSFTVRKWEKNITEALAGALLSQNGTVSTKITEYDGIVLQLHKVSSSTDIDQFFGVSKANDGDDTASIFFLKNNNFRVNADDLRQISEPFAVVSAQIDPLLWDQSGLDSLEPAQPISDSQHESGRAVLSATHRLLPSNGSLLSFAGYIGNSEKVTRLSVRASPTRNLASDHSVYQLEKESESEAALNGVSSFCVFLRTFPDGNRSWSTEGCRAVSSEDGVVRCRCNHTTTFGVLLAVRTFTVPKAVTTILMALEVVTILALIVTVALLLWLRRSMHSDRTVVQINLAGSLLLLHFFFILGDSAAKLLDSKFCEACAVLSQYFVLTTALWMLNEGAVLYFKTYKNALTFNLKRVYPKIFAFAWGFPLLYVTICAAVGLSLDVYLDTRAGYRPPTNGSEVVEPKYNRCWLSTRSGMIYTVVAPLVVIFAITSFVLVKTAVSIRDISRDAKNMQPSGRTAETTNSSSNGGRSSAVEGPTSSNGRKRKSVHVVSKHAEVALRAVILLLPVLGVTWFIAFLVNIPGAEVVFIILHGIVNGLQGVFVFYIYCIKNSQFRRVFRRKWNEISSNRFGSEFSQKSSRNSSHAMSSRAGK